MNKREKGGFAPCKNGLAVMSPLVMNILTGSERQDPRGVALGRHKEARPWHKDVCLAQTCALHVGRRCLRARDILELTQCRIWGQP